MEKEGPPPSYEYKGPPASAPPPGGPTYPPGGPTYPPAGPPAYTAQYGGQYATPAGGAPYGQPSQGYSYASVVVQQPAPTPGPPPPDHMKAAIFATLCCFWPTGLLAIMKAMNAKEAAARGDMVTANSLARSAHQMVKVSVVCGIIGIIFAAVIIGLYVGFILNIDHDDFYDD